MQRNAEKRRGGDGSQTGLAGRYYEDFEVGDIYPHPSAAR